VIGDENIEDYLVRLWEKYLCLSRWAMQAVADLELAKRGRGVEGLGDEV